MNFFQRNKHLLVIVALFSTATYFGGKSVFNFFVSEKAHFPPCSNIPDRLLDQSKRNNILFGNVITLKTMREDFIESYHDMFSADVRHGLSFTASPNDENYTIGYLNWTLSRQAQGELMCYAIFDNKDDVLVGAIEVRAHHSEDPGQLGCWINEKYRGGGRMQEALKLITQEYFRMTGAPTVSAFIEPFNIASYKALTKFGFRQKSNNKTYKKVYNTFEYDNPELAK